MGQHVWMVVAIAVTVLVLLAGGFLLRLRYLAGQVGSASAAPRGDAGRTRRSRRVRPSAAGGG